MRQFDTLFWSITTVTKINIQSWYLLHTYIFELIKEIKSKCERKLNTMNLLRSFRQQLRNSLERFLWKFYINRLNPCEICLKAAVVDVYWMIFPTIPCRCCCSNFWCHLLKRKFVYFEHEYNYEWHFPTRYDFRCFCYICCTCEALYLFWKILRLQEFFPFFVYSFLNIFRSTTQCFGFFCTNKF